MKLKHLALVLIFAAACGGSQKVDEPTPEPSPEPTAPAVEEPVTFEILQDGEVVAQPSFTTTPGPMVITHSDVAFNLTYVPYEAGARLYGDWTGGEITAVDGPFGTRISIVVDPERGLELVVTAKKP